MNEIDSAKALGLELTRRAMSDNYDGNRARSKVLGVTCRPNPKDPKSLRTSGS